MTPRKPLTKDEIAKKRTELLAEAAAFGLNLSGPSSAADGDAWRAALRRFVRECATKDAARVRAEIEARHPSLRRQAEDRRPFRFR
jgi:hypothetical protein